METCKVAAIATQVFKTFAIIKKCYEIEGKQTIKDHQQLINLIKQQYSVGHVADASQLFREGDVGGWPKDRRIGGQAGGCTKDGRKGGWAGEEIFDPHARFPRFLPARLSLNK